MAVSGLVANAVTEGLFNTNLIEFVTGTVDGRYRPGIDGANTITIPELLGAGPGGFGGNYGSAEGGFTGAVKRNVKKNWFPMVSQMIFIPVAAKIATKFLRKPLLTPANKILKMTGLDVKV